MRIRFLGLVTAALLAATAPVVAASELVYVVNNEASRYDPGTSVETFAAPIIGNTFEGLVRFAPDGSVVPALAESWEISEDGLTYTFHLRDAKWSDGQPLTAHDFVYSWTRVLTPATGAMNAVKMYLIEGGEEFYNAGGEGDLAVFADDDRTFRFQVKQRVPYMLQLLPHMTFFPVRQDVVEADPDGWTRNPATFIGNGPFRVTEFRFGESVIFEKNPNYYAADEVSLEKLTFRLIPDPATALAAIEAGQVDGIEAVPAPEIPRLSVESDAFRAFPALGTTYAFISPHTAPVDDVRVRKALSMAIDREELVEFVLQAPDVPATGLVVRSMMLDGEQFNTDIGIYGLDTVAQPEAAQALLAEAGYPNGEGFPDTVFMTYSSPPVEKMLEAIQQMWKQNLNIDVAIQATEWQVYFPEVQRVEYQIAQMGWGADYPHPLTFLDNFVTGNPNNLINWSNADYDAAIAAAKAGNDEGETLAKLREAEAIIMNEHVILPQYHRNAYMMMGSHVDGFWRSVQNIVQFRDVSINR